MAKTAPEENDPIATSRLFIAERVTDDVDAVSEYVQDRLREARLDEAIPSSHHVSVDITHLPNEGSDDLTPVRGFECTIDVLEADDDYTQDDLHQWARSAARNAVGEFDDDE